MWSGAANWYACLGHVEAFGVTHDNTWVFFDPMGRGTVFEIDHRKDVVDHRMAVAYTMADTIYRIPHSDRKITFPIHPTMNCVSQCAAIVGLRAYKIRTFQKKLRRNGAEIVYGPSSESRGSRSQRART